ncbi:MAG: DUF1015 domain-containing protein [Syntrophobacteria bacterium]
MVDIAPFRGLLYNQRLVPDLKAVITPPYDVISPEEQEMYHRRHPYNMIRLILGKHEPGDNEHNNWCTRAAATLHAWQRQGVLVREPQPVLYDYEIEYREPPNLLKTRQGFFCVVRLQEFSDGSVRPHERTYEATKSERLKLMSACGANLSQIFSLYADSARVVSYYLRQGREDSPVFDFTDSAGIHHRMWRVTRTDIIHKVAGALRDKPLFIADGHHRYETALAYERLMRQKYPDRGSQQAAFRYTLMYLSNMNHTGLTILPTNRVFVRLPQFQMDSFLRKAAEYFEVVGFPFDAASRNHVLETFLSALRSAGDRHFIGVYEAGAGQFVLLRLRSRVDHQVWRGYLPEPLQKLDVVVLTELILKRLLNIDSQMLNDEKRILIRHNAWEAIEQVDRGLFHVAFLLNPTRIEQVQEVASSGLIMPHKSTYFYPKVMNGSVLNLLDPNEDVSL